MYTDFYHLSEKPFNITPDPKFLYLNARYREALASLNYGIAERKGFITLIGEAGTGKTTLLNKLLDQLDDKTKTVFIFNTNVTFEEILEYIFNEFDLPVHSGKKLYMLQRLNAFLLEELRNGGNVAVLIDEAQDLDMGVLENLRLLSNLETAKEKILQIVLSGQPELEKKLSSPELRQLRQRIAVNCRLTPLSRDELSEYIEYRLQAAGCADPKMFTREAEEQVWHFSHGIPRLVNVVCDNALVIGYALGKKRVSAEIVREASADLLATQISSEAIEIDAVAQSARPSEPVPAAAPPARSRSGAWALFALVAAALVVGFLSMGRRLLPHAAEQPAKANVGSERTIMHPGQLAQDVPPAQLGLDHPSAARPEEAAVQRPAAVVPPAAPPAVPPQPAAAPPAANPVAEAPRPAAVAPAPAAPAVEPPHAAAPAAEPKAHEVAAVPAPAAPVPKVEPPKVEVAKLEPPKPVEAPPRDVSQEIATAVGIPEERGEKPLADGVSEGGRGEVRLSNAEYDRITVRDGDSFAQIAVRKYGQSSYTILDLLKLANPSVADIDRIAAGQTLALPRLSQGFPIVKEDGRGYGVLAYSTPISARAQALSKALRSRGFASNVTTATIGPGRQVQRVIVGPFSSEEEAAGAGRDVQRAFREDEQLAALGRS